MSDTNRYSIENIAVALENALKNKNDGANCVNFSPDNSFIRNDKKVFIKELSKRKYFPVSSYTVNTKDKNNGIALFLEDTDGNIFWIYIPPFILNSWN